MIEKLKIIPSAQVISFELPSDERAVKIAQDINRDGKLKNPLLVYPLDDKYLILDDVSIIMALESLDVVHIPVQLADMNVLSVRPWQRVVDKCSRDNLLEFCERFPKQIRIEISSDGDLAANQAEFRFPDKSRQRLTLTSKSYMIRSDICAMLLNHISCHHTNYRVKLDYHDSDVLRGFSKASVAVFPPYFSLPELAGLALHDVCLPRGIVRVNHPNRVLGVDYSLSVLREKVPASEKELFLRQMLQMRISSDRVNYYDGGVFMFNG